MPQKRHNIGTIAEVLIDKLDEIQKHTERLEKVAQRAGETKLKVDTTKLDRLISEQKQTQESFLFQLNELTKRNKNRLPNHLLYLVVSALALAVLALGICYFQLSG